MTPNPGIAEGRLRLQLIWVVGLQIVNEVLHLQCLLFRCESRMCSVARFHVDAERNGDNHQEEAEICGT